MNANGIDLYFGYFPGVIGKVTELHAVYYHEHWGFDLSFESQVGLELSEFMAKFDPERDGLWSAFSDGEFTGAVAIDGRPVQGEGARLRWFIVRPGFQGQGVGRLLIRQCVDFCRSKGYPKIHLWTFKGLDAARRLYERKGFRLCVEHEVAQWGTRIREQKFELVLKEEGTGSG
ncbi:MAG: GNAT family N-acetyltransferase [Deltaproteobacteria bacterium]|nr:GNAT family N-acetyltransferase [Deltaproteobacteria bacterium]